MQIKDTNVNVIYPRIMNYRKKFVESEDILKLHFKEPSILPIPEEIQGDVPRIVVETINGHSSLNIGLEVAAFATKYDSDYVNNWDKCQRYLNEKGETIYNIIESMTDHNLIFSGVIVNVVYDDIGIEGIELIKKNLLKLDKIETPFDAGLKLTYIYSKKYYVNISIENAREFLALQQGYKSIIQEQVANNIHVVIDVNDRYASNYDSSYKSSKKEFESILGIISDIINNKLYKLLVKGEFGL